MSTMWNGCLADTDYFEIDAKSGHRFGVWVTVPMTYALTEEPMPLIYVTDGNYVVGQTAPLIVTQHDPYLSVAPYIQVSIGYAGDEAVHWAQLRNRDLVPPNEPVSDEMRAALQTALDAGTMTQEAMDAYLAELADTHADAFLDFISHELHPRLKAEYRVSDSGHGLFGYSYGGLFSLYAWLRGGTPFATIGAGSPGVAVTNSEIYSMVDAIGDGETDRPKLHMTLNRLERDGEIPIYRTVAANALKVLDQLKAKGYEDKLSFDLLDGTHLTGVQASFVSYLKTCHAG